MDDFPSNSDRSKDETAPEQKIVPVAETKKMDKVVEGEVIRRKKPLGRKFKELFIGGSASMVGEYILYDILIPAIKDTIADVTTQGVERMMFGEVRSSSRRISSRRGRDNYTNYTDYTKRSQHKPPWETDRRPDPRRDRRKPPGRYDFDEIIIPSRAEAEKVIDRLFEVVSKYESASVADLYELLGISSGSYMDNKWGWYDIRGADLVVRTTRGYLLNLPDPEPLNQ